MGWARRWSTKASSFLRSRRCEPEVVRKSAMVVLLCRCVLVHGCSHHSLCHCGTADVVFQFKTTFPRFWRSDPRPGFPRSQGFLCDLQLYRVDQLRLFFRSLFHNCLSCLLNRQTAVSLCRRSFVVCMSNVFNKVTLLLKG